MTPSEELRAALGTVADTWLPSAAKADKRGKFPMAILRFPPDGSPAEMIPLTVAMTEETWTTLWTVYLAARACVRSEATITEGDAVPRPEGAKG